MPEKTSWPVKAVVLVILIRAATAASGNDSTSSLPDSVTGGWAVFTEKQCIRCHAVWDVGKHIGPDLGRTGKEHLTASSLTRTMWNHIPRMHSYMLQNRVEYPSISLAEMSDLFSFLYFVGHIEEPGNAAVGQRLVRERGCSRCHSSRAGEAAPGADMRRWASYANPIVWAQKMWEHAPEMEQAMREAGISWPQLSDTDLVNITAYVRTLGGSGPREYLQPGSAQVGSRLFSERKCRSCHTPGGPGKDLAAADIPASLGGLASRMWNHSPEMVRAMRDAGLERVHLTPQEMADIIAYILAVRSLAPAGDPQRGRDVFVRRHCARCHEEGPDAGSDAPSVGSLITAVTPVRLAHAMWNHGPAMLERMSERGEPWPVFEIGEVVDLIAYLESAGGGEEFLREDRRSHPSAEARSEAGYSPPVVDPEASCASNACHSRMLAGRAVHVPAAQGECEACHVLLDPELHRFELANRTSDLCYRCHDKLASNMKAHGPVAVTVCTACHQPHSAENLHGPSFTGDEMCFADIIAQTSALATLVESRPVTAPAVPSSFVAENQGPILPARGTGSRDSEAILPLERTATPEVVTKPPPATVGCISADCHAGLLSQEIVHPPAAQHQCEACHRPIDDAPHRFELAAKEPDLCYQCHDASLAKGKFVHGPVALGLCTPCHDAHSAPHRGLLPALGSALCFTCHTEMQTHVESARVQHAPLAEGEDSCVSCHEPHRSDFRHQLTKNVPTLCYDCHQTTREMIANAVVSHGSTDQCAACHNPHGSDVEKILAATEMDLCLGCHDRPMETPNGPIVDMKSWIADNPERHGPVREGLCTGCHLPHGSEHFRILRHGFPREFYRPFSRGTYALCFECHEETIVLDPTTTTLTAFRNGDKNLHYVHVNRKKGRTCRACHEIHAGTKPKRMKDFVPFGQWKYPVNFEKTSNGGRCTPGCHVARAYDRIREVVQE